MNKYEAEAAKRMEEYNREVAVRERDKREREREISERDSYQYSDLYERVENLSFEEKREIITKKFPDQELLSVLSESEKELVINHALYQELTIEERNAEIEAYIEENAEKLDYRGMERVKDAHKKLKEDDYAYAMETFSLDYAKKIESVSMDVRMDLRDAEGKVKFAKEQKMLGRSIGEENIRIKHDKIMNEKNESKREEVKDMDKERKMDEIKASVSEMVKKDLSPENIKKMVEKHNKIVNKEIEIPKSAISKNTQQKSL